MTAPGDKPSPLDLFASQGSGTRGTALVGWDTEDQLARNYLAAGRTLAHAWADETPEHRGLVIPMMAVLRHGIELTLKVAIREAGGCLRRDGHDDCELEGDVLDGRLSSTHRIGDLADRLDGYLRRLMGEGTHRATARSSPTPGTARSWSPPGPSCERSTS